MTRPIVGQIVTYLSRGSADGHFMPVERAAIIVGVEGTPIDPAFPNTYPEDDYSVTLMVMTPTGIFFDEHVIFSPEGEEKPGCWSWPVRV